MFGKDDDKFCRRILFESKVDLKEGNRVHRTSGRTAGGSIEIDLKDARGGLWD